MEVQKVFKCFISSPGDCEKEGEICQVVLEKINNGFAKSF